MAGVAFINESPVNIYDSGQGLGMTLPLVFMRVVGNAILHILFPPFSPFLT